MIDTKGLLNNAKRLTTKARVKRDNAAGVQADAQFSTAFIKLTSQFPALQAQLANRAALHAAGITIGPAPDLAKSVDRLRGQIVEYGRPTPQFLNSRATELAGAISALQALNDAAWRDWAGSQVTSLAIERDLLHGPRGQVVKEKLAGLALLAGRPFNATDLTLFKLGVDSVQDLIGELRDPMRPEEVTARIRDARGALTFADLTDQEVDVLRTAAEFGRQVRLSVR